MIAEQSRRRQGKGLENLRSDEIKGGRDNENLFEEVKLSKKRNMVSKVLFEIGCSQAQISGRGRQSNSGGGSSWYEGYRG